MTGTTSLLAAPLTGVPLAMGWGLPSVVIGEGTITVVPFIAQTQSLTVTDLAIRVVVALGVTAGLLLIITHLLQRFGYGTSGSTRTRPSAGGKRVGTKATRSGLTVEQILPLTRHAKVATITIEGHRLLVGVTDQQVSLLKDLGAADESPGQPSEPVTGELERYPIDPAVLRAAQLRSRQSD